MPGTSRVRKLVFTFLKILLHTLQKILYGYTLFGGSVLLSRKILSHWTGYFISSKPEAKVGPKDVLLTAGESMYVG